MIADALAGKIDLIITKSVSRFARNTVDSLTTVRELKDKGIEIYFEKENIWTLDSKGELLITIMSSLAQEESRSISENVTWGQRKRMADGKVSFAYSRFLGLDKDKETGKIRADLICLANETFDENEDMVLFDPNETWKRTRIVGGTYTMRKLLVPIFEEGKCVYTSPSVMEIQSICTQEKATLWDENMRFVNPSNIYVDLSDNLYDLKQKVFNELSAAKYHIV